MREYRSINGEPRALFAAVSGGVLPNGLKDAVRGIPLELIENGMEAEKRKRREFFDLAERFRGATDPAEVKRLGEQMGRMVFGG